MNVQELMLTSLLNCRRVDLYADPVSLTPEQEAELQDMQARYDQGEPLQYILGTTEFCGLNLTVDPRVLIPRPETEILVEAVLCYVTENNRRTDKTLKILDLGTGSGNIALALKNALSAAEITAVDRSEPAVRCARENARRHDLQNIDFICEDMFDYLPRMQRTGTRFNLIVSNPPYIAREMLKKLPVDVQREPTMALDGGIDGLDFYRQMIPLSLSVLNTQGALFLEIGDGQDQRIEKLICQHTDLEVSFQPDYKQINRILIVQ